MRALITAACECLRQRGASRAELPVSGFGEAIRASEFTSLLRLNDALPRNFALEQNFPNPLIQPDDRVQRSDTDARQG